MAMMSVKLLSVLVSLAMMLTGTYGVEAPQETARTLTLSNVTLTVNGGSATLEPTLSLGVKTDGAKALFTAAVLSGGSELFPVQLTVTEDALTALVKNADTAFTVPASAIDALTESAAESMGEVDSTASDLMSFMFNEYIPAYTRVLEKAMDPDFSAQLRQKSQALMDEKLDRGAGQAGSIEIDGQEYDCTTYHYTLDAAQMMSLSDELMAQDEDLNALYSAVFKLYNMMPEESGLNGISSFTDLVEKMGLTLTADITESVSADGSVRQEDAVVTLDLAAMVASLEESSGETTELTDANAVAPMVIYTSATQVGDDYLSTANMDYTVEGVSMNMETQASQGAEGFSMVLDMTIDAGDEGGMQYTVNVERAGDEKQAEVTMDFTADDVDIDSTMTMSASTNPDTGNKTYDVEATLDVVEPQNMRFAMSAMGEIWPEGDSHNSLAFTVDAENQTASLSFDADVSSEDIQEAAAGSDALVIDDLTNLDGLMSDETSQGRLMQAAGSFIADAGTLTSEASVTNMVELLESALTGSADSQEVLPDKAAEAEEPEIDEEKANMADEPEDDGVLSFEMPQFAYVPEGWKAGETEVDTAYDQVVMTFADETYENNLYATFISSAQASESYVMNGEGALVPAEDRNVKVEHLEADNWMATVIHGNVTCELYINSPTIDLDTIAQIINGLTF